MEAFFFKLKPGVFLLTHSYSVSSAHLLTPVLLPLSPRFLAVASQRDSDIFSKNGSTKKEKYSSSIFLKIASGESVTRPTLTMTSTTWCSRPAGKSCAKFPLSASYLEDAQSESLFFSLCSLGAGSDLFLSLSLFSILIRTPHLHA